MSNEIQTVITILIVFAMVLLGIRTIKKYGIKVKIVRVCLSDLLLVH